MEKLCRISVSSEIVMMDWIQFEFTDICHFEIGGIMKFILSLALYGVFSLCLQGCGFTVGYRKVEEGGTKTTKICFPCWDWERW